jgi:hypothetical protein
VRGYVAGSKKQNKARGYCCRTLGGHWAPLQPGRVQPGGIYAHAVRREPTPGGPGSGFRRGRKRVPVPAGSGYIFIDSTSSLKKCIGDPSERRIHRVVLASAGTFMHHIYDTLMYLNYRVSIARPLQATFMHHVYGGIASYCR